MTDELVLSRVNARKQAADAIELLLDVRFPNDDASLVFWTLIRDAAIQRAPLPAIAPRRGTEPMTDAQAREFEKVLMPFGKYEGTPVGDVHEEEPGYLDWLLNGDDFKVQLNRYLMADRTAPDLDDET